MSSQLQRRDEGRRQAIRTTGSRARRVTLTAAVLAACLVVLGSVLVSPLALQYLDIRQGVDWLRLSAIGQTYGAASALLSALAVAGVAASLLLQARDTKINRAYLHRERHGKLIEMALEDPLYQACFGEIPGVTVGDRWRQHVYINLLVASWWSGYEVGIIPDPELRANFADVFRGVPGREFWALARTKWQLSLMGSHQGRRFYQLADEQYHWVIANGATHSSQLDDPSTANTRHDSRALRSDPLAKGVVLGFAGGVLAGATLSRKQKRGVHGT
jgi:hypothetical protein